MSLFVADLFSGLDGWGAAFRDRGHHVVSFDLDPRFGSNVVVDMNNVKAVNGFDVILASPPCECFSVMTIGRNWNKDRTPKTERAKDALALAHHTFALIENAKPRWYIVENPRGMLRKVAPRPPTTTTWYCQWGMPYAKPTDLWTNIEGFWPACRTGSLDHRLAPRGSTTGIQGLTFGNPEPKRPPLEWTGPARAARDVWSDKASAIRALIPYRLSLAVCLAAERDGTLPSMEEVIKVESELRRIA